MTYETLAERIYAEDDLLEVFGILTEGVQKSELDINCYKAHVLFDALYRRKSTVAMQAKETIDNLDLEKIVDEERTEYTVTKKSSHKDYSQKEISKRLEKNDKLKALFELLTSQDQENGGPYREGEDLVKSAETYVNAILQYRPDVLADAKEYSIFERTIGGEYFAEPEERKITGWFRGIKRFIKRDTNPLSPYQEWHDQQRELEELTTKGNGSIKDLDRVVSKINALAPKLAKKTGEPEKYKKVDYQELKRTYLESQLTYIGKEINSTSGDEYRSKLTDSLFDPKVWSEIKSDIRLSYRHLNNRVDEIIDLVHEEIYQKHAKNHIENANKSIFNTIGQRNKKSVDVTIEKIATIIENTGQGNKEEAKDELYTEFLGKVDQQLGEMETVLTSKIKLYETAITLECNNTLLRTLGEIKEITSMYQFITSEFSVERDFDLQKLNAWIIREDSTRPSNGNKAIYDILLKNMGVKL